VVLAKLLKTDMGVKDNKKLKNKIVLIVSLFVITQ